MFHNEWSAEAAKPLQHTTGHTTGTETKTAIWDGVGWVGSYSGLG
jgi:hypothetical protein